MIGFASAVVLYLSRVADAGIDLGLGIREIAHGDVPLEVLVPSLSTLRVLLAGGLILLTVPTALVLLPHPDGLVLALYTLTLLPVAISTRWVHVGRERTRLVGAARAGGEAVMLSVIFLTVHTTGALFRVPLAQLAGDSLAAMVLALALGRGRITRLGWRPDIVLPVVRRAIPYVGSTLLGLMIYNADLIFLRVIRGTESVGHYAAAYAPISFLINVAVAYALSLLPTITRLRADSRAERELYQTSIMHIFAVALPVAVGGALVAPGLIALIFGIEFRPSGPVLATLVWSVPISAVRDAPIMAILSRRREDLVLRIVAMAAALNLILNLILIVPFGMQGAAVATVTTELVRMGLAFRASRRMGFVPPAVRRCWRPALASAAMAGLVVMTPRWPVIARVALGAIGYGSGLALLGGLRLRGRSLPALEI